MREFRIIRYEDLCIRDSAVAPHQTAGVAVLGDVTQPPFPALPGRFLGDIGAGHADRADPSVIASPR